MKYYLYRVSGETGEIDYFPPDVQPNDEDVVILYKPVTLEIFRINDGENTVQTSIDIRSIMDKFSFVSEVTPTTSKMFKKKAREITKSDFELILQHQKTN